jgi:murein hydrolase activator
MITRASWALVLWAAVSICAAPWGVVRAQSPDLPAQAAEDMRAAISRMQSASAASDRVAALTDAIQAYEIGLGALREGLRRVVLQEQNLLGQLSLQSGRLSSVLGAMTAVERNEAGPVLLLHPAGPLGMARSGLLLADVAPALESEATKLRAQLQNVASLRTQQQQAVAALQAGLEAAQNARIALSQAVAARVALPRKLVESPQELRRMLAGVETLDAFADLLQDRQTTPGDDLPSFAAQQGQMPLPVLGRVVRHFAQDDVAGVRRPGLLLATRPLALVTAPTAMTLRYRGPLLDYGNVMILEPGDGFLLILAGLDVVYGEVGDVVPPGAPIGMMGGRDGAASEFLALMKEGSGKDLTETLYMELRYNSEPIDPAPWFARTQ